MAKLHYKYGAMNAGKSTIVIQTAYNYEERKQKVLLMKPAIDTKGDNTVVSRIGISRTVDVLIGKEDNLLDEKFLEIVRGYNCIIVDEAQFLEPNQIEDLWIITKQLDIPVICYGLKTNFKTEAFPGSMRLFELSDELVEMPTICDCGKKARFNARKVNGEYVREGASVVIDNDAVVEYVPLCGKCYQDTLMQPKSRIRK